MLPVFADLDGLIRRGVNVTLLAQSCTIVKANPAGIDFLYDGPKLYHPSKDGKQTYSIRLYACEWADHVVRIGYLDQQVSSDKAPDPKGRTSVVGKARGTTKRAIYAQPEPHFFAKTRTLTEAVISFEDAKDASLWGWLFPQ